MRRMGGFLAAALGIAALAGEARAKVGDWTSYTALSQVRDIEAVPGGILVATTGGVRHIEMPSRREKVYRNTEGLTDVTVQSLVRLPDGAVWAASELGYLYRLAPGASRWTVHGASYKASGWRMNRRAMLYRAGYLILGSEKGLTFFNTEKLVADANITKMGSATGVAVHSLLLRGDTLHAGTDKGVFRAVLPFGRLLTDNETNIFNPAIWAPVEALQAAPDTASAEGGLPDTTRNCAPGLLYMRDGKLHKACAGSAVPERGGLLLKGRLLEMEGREVPDTLDLEALAHSEGRWFFGGDSGLYEYAPSLDIRSPFRNPDDLPAGNITMVHAGPSGVHLYASPLLYKAYEGGWGVVPYFFGPSAFVDASKRGSDPLHVTPEGEAFLGSWGLGLFAFQDGRTRHLDADSGKGCMESALEDVPNYPVVWSMAPFRSSGAFIGNLRVAKNYRLSYYDFGRKTLECFQVASTDENPRALEVVGDSVLVVVTGRGLEAFRIREAGGRVSLDPQDLLSPQSNAPELVLDARMDHAGNLWVSSEGGKLFHVPDIRFGSGKAQTFRALEGFPGTECRNIERDGRGHLWVGCTQGGLIEVIPGKDSLSSHAFRRYRLEDGLLSETVLHLDVDEERGDVWIVTEKGINRFESPSRPLARSLSSAKVYPNPFRARHEFVLFDNLSAGSEVQVLTQGGSVVYRAALGADDGGQLRWDGRNAAGRKVTEGVYFYVIRTSRDVKRGKLIVAR